MARKKKYQITKEKAHNLEFYQNNAKELQKLIKTANRRWRELEKLGLPSRAIDEALDIRKRKYFRAEDFKTKNGLANLTRLRNFLADPTSLPGGARYYKATVLDVKEFKDLYGDPWETDEQTGLRFNNYAQTFEAEYGEDFTSRIYANYRKLEDDRNELLSAGILPESFDSETLITAMFSMAVEGVQSSGVINYRDELDAPEYGHARDILDYYKRHTDYQRERFDKLMSKANLFLHMSENEWKAKKEGRYTSW